MFCKPSTANELRISDWSSDVCSSDLSEELIHRAIVERDFKEEFLTYWLYNASTDKRYIHSLLNLRGPSRAVVMWKGEDMIIVGETPKQLQSWVANRFGRTSSFQHEPIKGAAFLWLEEPLLPTDHPKTASDLMKIAGAVGGEAQDILAGIIGQQSSDLVVLLGARGRHGAGVVGVTIPPRSEEHTSELQSLMRISYAVFCLKTKNNKDNIHTHTYTTQR